MAAALGLTFALAACIPAPRPEPAPTPPPVQTSPPPPPPAAPAQPTYSNWMDAPRTAGDWSYRTQAGGSLAQFGTPGAGAGFAMRCNAAQREIVLTRESGSGQPVPMRIRTETAERVVTAQPVAGQVSSVAVAIPARDPILDAMALTKGRFAIEAQGSQTLYLPAWAEVTRVIEDCR
ncbi:hypothetical protein [Erythrobacter sp. QSSC1-22B]|uniref:hypothetical protein n=1 Tax=Erythrobacter sp. QSSC1-22B TaxID=1860125 RepID=UPI00143B42EB|nr:hypothetical protein [Erythrobacter sp. QSSC1-22B]